MDETTNAEYFLRLIKTEDNPTVAHIIRKVMTEFGCVGEGYSIMDPEVDAMSDAYNNPQSAFFVVEKTATGEVLGCGGIGPLAGDDGTNCELKKMYFLPELRGQGFGEKMVAACLAKAKEIGYRQCYLETVARMEQANKLYKKMGFAKMDGPMGATGHCSCELWYLKTLDDI